MGLGLDIKYLDTALNLGYHAIVDLRFGFDSDMAKVEVSVGAFESRAARKIKKQKPLSFAFFNWDAVDFDKNATLDENMAIAYQKIKAHKVEAGTDARGVVIYQNDIWAQAADILESE